MPVLVLVIASKIRTGRSVLLFTLNILFASRARGKVGLPSLMVSAIEIHTLPWGTTLSRYVGVYWSRTLYPLLP